MAKEWLWVEPEIAAGMASNGDVVMERLRLGHGFTTPSEFVRRLRKGEFKVLAFRNNTAALVETVDTCDGLLLNILTVYGKLDTCEESIKYLEDAAKEIGVASIISVGHMGWLPIMKRNGYHTERKLLMRKKLHD